MTPDSLTKENILIEVKKLQYLYGLKTEIRYGQSRAANDLTESVAEHIYGMHILAQYFLPLEDPMETMDRLRILEMITLHDIDELETGDVIGYLKTPAMRDAGKDAAKRVLQKIPDLLYSHWRELHTEYETQHSKEAQFVKALDRFEPLIHIYNKKGFVLVQKNKTTAYDSDRIKINFIAPFPCMFRFYQIIHQAMIDEGFFQESEKN